MTQAGAPDQEAADSGAPSAQEGGRRPFLDVGAGVAARFLLVVAASAVILYALVRLRVVVLPVIVALFISTLLAPVVSWLAARGLHRLVATWAVLLLSLALLSGLFVLLAPQVASELGEIGTRVRQGTEEVITWLVDGPLQLTRQEVNDYVDQVVEQVRSSSGSLTSGVLAGAIVLAELVAGLLLTLVLVFFFLKDGERMWSWLTARSSDARRPHIDALGRRVWTTMGAYLRGTAFVALVDAILIGIALVLIGVPLVIPLAILTFFGGFLPLIGAVAAGAVATLVALVSGGVLDAALVAAAVTVVQQVEGDVLQPLVLGRAVKLHPVVIILSLAAGSVLAGIVGAFLSVPVAAVATVIASYLRTHREALLGTRGMESS